MTSNIVDVLIPCFGGPLHGSRWSGVNTPPNYPATPETNVSRSDARIIHDLQIIHYRKVRLSRGLEGNEHLTCWAASTMTDLELIAYLNANLPNLRAADLISVVRE
ncbi:hypothetical protein MAUB1S_11443 [Mycolicibacterium aubagnense]